jgi:hypothetical protein
MEKVEEEGVTEIPIWDEVALASMEPKVLSSAHEQPKLKSTTTETPRKGKRMNIVLKAVLQQGFLYRLLLAETIAGYQKLVELCKGLVVLPCLASSVEVYEIHDPVVDGYHDLWVKVYNLCTV